MNYTTFLNVLMLGLAAWLYFRYRRTGGPAMMKAMENEDHDRQRGDSRAREHEHR